MNDPRPSEDTDRLELREMRRRGFFKGLPTGEDFITPSELAGVDHAHEAGRHITWAHQQQDDLGEYDHSVRDNATLAVAEATLALAEQQRISNLIAFEQVTGEKNRAEIRKGLGL